MSSTSIGTVLATLMRKFDLNALDLERHTGVPSSTIYRLLKNKDGNPTVDVLKKLASFFQVTVSQLIGEDPIGSKYIPLIPSTEILHYLNASSRIASKYPTVPIDFPLSAKCFATYVQDDLMEPFLLFNSIVIIDPERKISHKDFVLYSKDRNGVPQIRQIIKDGEDIYLKALNSNFPFAVVKGKNIKKFTFIGVIIHYRTNLYTLKNERILSEENIIIKTAQNND